MSFKRPKEAQQCAKIARGTRTDIDHPAARKNWSFWLKYETSLSSHSVFETNKSKQSDVTQSMSSSPRQSANIVEDSNQATVSSNAKSTQRRPKSSAQKTNFRELYGALPWPAKGNIFRRFGKQKDPITGQTVQSRGLDIKVASGRPVRSVAPGVVKLAKVLGDYGQIVVITHGQYTTVYAHLDGIKVTQGSQVAAGQIIGLTGNSGITDEQNSPMLTFLRLIQFNTSKSNALAKAGRIE